MAEQGIENNLLGLWVAAMDAATNWALVFCGHTHDQTQGEAHKASTQDFAVSTVDLLCAPYRAFYEASRITQGFWVETFMDAGETATRTMVSGLSRPSSGPTDLE